MSYSMDFFDTAAMDETFKYVLLIYGAIFLVILVFAFISYLFKGIGMYGMAKRLGVSDPWLAFIPIASNFLQGELAKPFTIGKKQIKNPGVWTLVYPFIFGAVFFVLYFAMIPMVAFNSATFDTNGEIPTFLAPFFGYVLFMVVVLVAAKAVQYAIYGLMRFKTNLHYMDSGKAVVHVLLGLFIPLYQSFFYFSMRNRIPTDLPSEPQTYPYAPPNAPQQPTTVPPQPPVQPNP